LLGSFETLGGIGGLCAIKFDRLTIAGVARVVVASVTQIDATLERKAPA
jgi:hypothetical protein